MDGDALDSVPCSGLIEHTGAPLCSSLFFFLFSYLVSTRGALSSGLDLRGWCVQLLRVLCPQVLWEYKTRRFWLLHLLVVDI